MPPPGLLRRPMSESSAGNNMRAEPDRSILTIERFRDKRPTRPEVPTIMRGSKPNGGLPRLLFWILRLQRKGPVKSTILCRRKRARAEYQQNRARSRYGWRAQVLLEKPAFSLKALCDDDTSLIVRRTRQASCTARPVTSDW
jgi:hypothetical protein